MRTQPLPLQSFRLKNFKAVRDSGIVKFTPLTVFIGNNGSGKSSLIEGLETLQSIVSGGLDNAMEPWRGFEHIWNQATPHRLRALPDARDYYTNPLHFELRFSRRIGYVAEGIYACLEVNLGSGGNEIFISHEEFTVRIGGETHTAIRNSNGQIGGPIVSGSHKYIMWDDNILLGSGQAYIHSDHTECVKALREKSDCDLV